MPRKKRLVAMRASHAAQTLRRLKQLPRDEVSNLDFLLNSELSPLVKCSNHAFVVSMERQMNIWFRHHVVNMEKLCRGQASEYRNLMRVKNDMRRMYREGVIRRREDEEFHRRLTSRREQDEVEFKMMFLAIEDGREKELERMKAQETLRRRLDKSRRIEPKDGRYTYSDNFLKTLYATKDQDGKHANNPPLPNGEQRQESFVIKGTGSRPARIDGEVEKVSASEVHHEYDGDRSHDIQIKTGVRDQEARGEAPTNIDSSELSANVNVVNSDSKVFSGVTWVPDGRINLSVTASSSGLGPALRTEKRTSDIRLATLREDSGKSTSTPNKEIIQQCEASNDKKQLREREMSKTVDDHNDSKLRMALNNFSATYVDTSSREKAATEASTKVFTHNDPHSHPTKDKWESSVRVPQLPGFEVAPSKSVTRYKREDTGALVGTTISVRPSDEQFPMPSKRAAYMQRKALQRLVEQSDLLNAKVDDFITDCETIYRPVSSLAHRPGLAYSRHRYVITGDDNHLQLGPRREYTAINVPEKSPGNTGAILDQSEMSRKQSVTIPGADGQQTPTAVQTLHK